MQEFYLSLGDESSGSDKSATLYISFDNKIMLLNWRCVVIEIQQLSRA